MKWIALTLGFMGSLHCVLMCGPLLTVLTGHQTTAVRFILYRLLYNTGRVITYTMMGIVLGFTEQIFSIHQYQEVLSVVLGVVLLVTIIIPRRYRSSIAERSGIYAILSLLRSSMVALLGSKRWEKHFILGVLNGFLPCGFVYAGLGYAALSGSVWSAAETMMYFGLGTLPAMMIMALVSEWFQSVQRWNERLRRLVPVGVVVIALLCIMRGLSLDIPYLSPKLYAQPGGVEQGCTPTHGQQSTKQ